MSGERIGAVLCHDMICTLDKDIVVGDRTLLKGTKVLLLPQTTADLVLVGDESLATLVPTFSRNGHVHIDDQTNLTSYAAQLLEYSNRLLTIETVQASIASRISSLESNLE